MSQLEGKTFFRTDRIALAPYLSIRGLKYVFSELDSSGKVYFVFEDPLSIANELGIEFERSELSSYNKLWHFYRGEVDKTKREVRQASVSSRYSNNKPKNY